MATGDVIDKTKEEEDINWLEEDGKTGLEEEDGDEENQEEQGGEEEGSEEAGDKKGEDEAKKEEDKTDGAGKEEGGEYSAVEEIRDLRSLLRDSKRQMAIMQAQLDRNTTKTDKALKASAEEDEDGNKITEEDKLSTIEELQRDLNTIGKTRGPILEVLAETMEQNPKYADLKEVCSRANFDDVFDAMASEMAKEGKGNKEELLLKVEADVWMMSNPYKFMYETIKESHPKYIKKEDDDKNSDKGGKDKIPKKGVDSLANTDGSGDKKGGTWTAAKIDALPEDELDKVPAEVYSKYLAGELQ